MRKGLKKRFVYFGVIAQIFLMISFSFTLSFIINNNFVNAAIDNTNLALDNPSGTGISTTAGLGGVSDFNGFNGPYNGLANQILPPPAAINPVSGSAPIIVSHANGYTPYQLPGGLGTISNPLLGHLAQGLVWAGLVAGAIQLLGAFGLGKGTTNALTISAVGGILAGQAVTGAFQSGYLNSLVAGNGKFFGLFKTAGQAGFAVGAVVAIALFIATYSSQTKKMVNFQCLPFQPALGGSQCQKCNNNPFEPCTEYRCRALGQACQLLNAGSNDQQCAWVSPNDVAAPTITPWNDALSPTGLKYTPDTAVNPPAIGTKIVTSGGGCLPAFTPLQFGITTNEPAQCKIDYNHTANYSDMQYYFGGSNYFDYNHTEILSLPGPNTGNNSIAPALQNNGQFSLYVRCMDANGNTNVAEYAFAFCVDQGPDTTPPVIEGSSIPSGSYVGYGQSNVPIELYTNEPATCNWDTQDKDYDSMANNMTCTTQSYQVNANLQYTCFGNLTGIQNNKDNTFYFRCKDQPDKPDNQRNVDVQSTTIVLKGSQPLVILSAAPNGTITGSTDTIPVNLQLETSAGATGDGNSTCSFSSTGQNDSYVAMFQTDSFTHSQTLNLATGDYTYYFRCIDSGGNAAETNTTFSVSVDTQPPIVTRVYKQDALKIVTNENAQCSYSLTSCNFNIADGIKMIYSNPDIQNNLFAEWKSSQTYYIRCMDLYGNEPAPNQCSIIVSPVTISGAQ